MELDLSSLQSIKDFVKRFRELEEHTHLNYLVHCDGVVFVGFGECITLEQVTLSSISCPSAEQTVDGFERHFQVVLACPKIFGVFHYFFPVHSHFFHEKADLAIEKFSW